VPFYVSDETLSHKKKSVFEAETTISQITVPKTNSTAGNRNLDFYKSVVETNQSFIAHGSYGLDSYRSNFI
jgi:hypothetical protein